MIDLNYRLYMIHSRTLPLYHLFVLHRTNLRKKKTKNLQRKRRKWWKQTRKQASLVWSRRLQISHCRKETSKNEFVVNRSNINLFSMWFGDCTTMIISWVGHADHNVVLTLWLSYPVRQRFLLRKHTQGLWDCEACPVLSLLFSLLFLQHQIQAQPLLKTQNAFI